MFDTTSKDFDRTSRDMDMLYPAGTMVRPVRGAGAYGQPGPNVGSNADPDNLDNPGNALASRQQQASQISPVNIGTESDIRAGFAQGGVDGAEEAAGIDKAAQGGQMANEIADSAAIASAVVKPPVVDDEDDAADEENDDAVLAAGADDVPVDPDDDSLNVGWRKIHRPRKPKRLKRGKTAQDEDAQDEHAQDPNAQRNAQDHKAQDDHEQNKGEHRPGQKEGVNEHGGVGRDGAALDERLGASGERVESIAKVGKAREGMRDIAVAGETVRDVVRVGEAAALGSTALAAGASVLGAGTEIMWGFAAATTVTTLGVPILIGVGVAGLGYLALRNYNAGMSASEAAQHSKNFGVMTGQGSYGFFVDKQDEDAGIAAAKGGKQAMKNGDLIGAAPLYAEAAYELSGVATAARTLYKAGAWIVREGEKGGAALANDPVRALDDAAKFTAGVAKTGLKIGDWVAEHSEIILHGIVVTLENADKGVDAAGRTLAVAARGGSYTDQMAALNAATKANGLQAKIWGAAQKNPAAVHTAVARLTPLAMSHIVLSKGSIPEGPPMPSGSSHHTDDQTQDYAIS